MSGVVMAGSCLLKCLQVDLGDGLRLACGANDRLWMSSSLLSNQIVGVYILKAFGRESKGSK